ncbi:MAG TPA: hypothetical protein VMZ28_28450 [Kofleriaceae bacterium]|nr:hypothetical protein [Kofleriaceae bacterium]
MEVTRMLSRIGLERLCLVLVAVMTAEIGYLWRAYTTPVERQVVVLEPVTSEPAPLVALAPGIPEVVPPQARPEPPAAALPRRRERPDRTVTPPARPEAWKDCARSNDPLCGLP